MYASLMCSFASSVVTLGFHNCVELSLVELNDLLLLAMHPADKNHEEELPGLKNEAHGGPHVTRKNLTLSPRAPSVNRGLRLKTQFWGHCNSRQSKLLRFG